MGTHREPPDRLTFSQWLFYRRNLAALKAEVRRDGWPLTPARMAQLKRQAREAARRAGG